MFPRRISTALATVAFATALAIQVRAAIAYDTLGPSNGFQGQSWILGEPNIDQDVAQSFQAWKTGPLESITLAISHYAFQNAYDVRLHSDENGQPGAMLDQWLSVEAPASALLTLTPTQLVGLTAGYNYWIAVSVPLGGQNTVGGWNYDTLPNNDQRFLFSQRGGAWTEQYGERGALRVEISEPSQPAPCPGDLDGDNDVDISDLTLFLMRFGMICP